MQPDFSRFWATLAEVPMLAKIARDCTQFGAMSTGCGSVSIDLGSNSAQNWPKVGQLSLGVSQVGATSAKVGRTLPILERARPESARIGHVLQFWPSTGHCGAMPAKFGLMSTTSIQDDSRGSSKCVVRQSNDDFLDLAGAGNTKLEFRRRPARPAF